MANARIIHKCNLVYQTGFDKRKEVIANNGGQIVKTHKKFLLERNMHHGIGILLMLISNTLQMLSIFLRLLAIVKKKYSTPRRSQSH